MLWQAFILCMILQQRLEGIRLRLPIWYLPSDLTQDAWINVTGTYHYDKHKGMEITVTDIEDAEPSEEGIHLERFGAERVDGRVQTLEFIQ